MKFYSFTLSERFPSLNDWLYANYKEVKKQKSSKKKAFYEPLAQCGKFKQFFIAVEYNNFTDVDNVYPAIKILLDVMKELRIILDDSPKYFKGVNITYNDNLAKHELVFTIIEK